jgi:hypothetical protein
MLAYIYFKIAAEKYENKDAYYFLGVLEYHKLVPNLVLL